MAVEIPGPDKGIPRNNRVSFVSYAQELFERDPKSWILREEALTPPIAQTLESLQGLFPDSELDFIAYHQGALKDDGILPIQFILQRRQRKQRTIDMILRLIPHPRLTTSMRRTIQPQPLGPFLLSEQIDQATFPWGVTNIQASPYELHHRLKEKPSFSEPSRVILTTTLTNLLPIMTDRIRLLIEAQMDLAIFHRQVDPNLDRYVVEQQALLQRLSKAPNPFPFPSIH